MAMLNNQRGNGIMWLKPCHKPPIWEWFIEPIYGDLRDGLLVYQRMGCYPLVMTKSLLWKIAHLVRGSTYFNGDFP